MMEPRPHVPRVASKRFKHLINITVSNFFGSNKKKFSIQIMIILLNRLLLGPKKIQMKSSKHILKLKCYF